MLYLFDRCYRKGDPKMMHVSSFLHLGSLFVLDSSTLSIVLKRSSTSMVARRVYKCTSTSTTSLSIEYERRKSRMLTECKCCSMHYTLSKVYSRWELLPNPNSSPPKSEHGLVELFGEIRKTVDQESQIVQAVFPNPAFVMQVFLQRVFAQSVMILQTQTADPH